MKKTRRMLFVSGLSSFSFLLACIPVVSATVLTLRNNCAYTVWPGVLSGDGAAVLGGGGFALLPSAAATLEAPDGWSGRLWARTGCVFDPPGGATGRCTTGSCGPELGCARGGAPPVTLAEFTLGGARDSYDVSLVGGYNVGIGVSPSEAGAGGSCRYAGCVADLNARCPAELRVGGDDDGQTVACRSACDAFGAAEYCCTGAHASRSTCGPTRYSQMFKRACPTAYSYAFDDAAASACTCPAGGDYTVTFCPS